MNYEFNRHRRDFGLETIEFDVKCPPIAENLSDETIQFEYETGSFVNKYAQKCFEEIDKPKYKWLDDWSFAGRSNGWFALLLNNGYSPEDIQQKSLDRIERIVQKYFDNYGKELENYYINQ